MGMAAKERPMMAMLLRGMKFEIEIKIYLPPQMGLSYLIFLIFRFIKNPLC